VIEVPQPHKVGRGRSSEGENSNAEDELCLEETKKGGDLQGVETVKARTKKKKRKLEDQGA